MIRLLKGDVIVIFILDIFFVCISLFLFLVKVIRIVFRILDSIFVKWIVLYVEILNIVRFLFDE